MKQLIITILTTVITTSCGLTSKYKNAQHSIYAMMLTTEEKNLINQNGEVTKNIEFLTDDSILKGTLRIIKTEKPDFYNFIEIGQWIDHSRLGNSGKYHNLEYKDTTVNDNLGNSLLRVVYYKDKPNEYQLGERWTLKQMGDLNIRHVEIFKDKVLVTEYDLRLVDFNKPLSDIQKKKMPIGTRKDYSSSGQLISTKTFDDNGKPIK